MKKVLLTGVAGFIGSFVARRLVEEGYSVVGIDSFSDYYDVQLKRDRVKHVVPSECVVVEGDILDKALLVRLAKKHRFDVIVHLAAQAGVRYSLDHPDIYVQTNVQGTNNVFELARRHGVKKVVYASSSSVYGGNKKVPFSEADRVDNPLSLYAATKRANELQAHVYAHLFGLDVVGLRFFTVYGPWGRPDMAAMLFASAIMKGEPIKVFNEGLMARDFTYIDDIADGVVAAVKADLHGFHLFNLGNEHMVQLDSFVGVLESLLGRKAKRELLPLQPGDVPRTSADVARARELLGFEPKTPVEEGLKRFVEWFVQYRK